MKSTFRILGIAMLVFTMSFASFHDKKIIVIDAGHGGHDFGATIDEHTEKAISASIAKKIKDLDNSENIEIVLLREADEFKSLQDRVDAINKLNADLVISLHVNRTPNVSASGIEAFVNEDNKNYESSKMHAETLLNSLSTETLKSRGVKMAPFFILKKSNSPAVTLELGFLSNENDRKYITSDEGQNEIASKIYNHVSK